MRPKILIVEDEAILARNLAISLDSAGYEITGSVSSGEEAIRTVEKSKPNLVLMDIHLQGKMDGVEAAESIRNRHDIPVVYLTAFAAENLLERAKKTEPYGFLSKPASLIELKSTIETTLYKHEADRRVRASEHELRLVTDSLESLLAHVNSEQRYLWANRAYRQFFGLGSSPIAGRHVRDVLGDRTYSAILHSIERALSGEKVAFETSTSGESGEVKDFSATYVPHLAPDGTVQGFIVQAVDITDRKKAEEALNRLNRELRTMSDCNQVLVRAEDEQALLNDICRIICDTAGYRMNWVGYTETGEAKTIRPVAWAGTGDGVLELASLTGADSELGLGPAGTAARSGQSACIQDLTIDSQVDPWREGIVNRGYRSCIALPLKDESDSTFGILCIYSYEPNAFTPDEIRFLEELSGNLAFGITALRARIELRRVEEALRESEKKVRRRLDAVLSPEIDIEALELSDIIDSEKIQKLMNEFYRLTNVGIGIIDLRGNVLVGTGWQDICTKFHRVNPESCRLCIESDLELSRNVPVGAFKQYRCKLNMWDIATPIMLDDKHVGNIFLGQFLFDDEVPEYEVFRRQARRYGFNEEEYLAALDRVPRWSRQKVDAAMSFYTAFASVIGNLSYSNIKLANTLEGRKRAEEALKEREEFLSSIVENIPDMIFIKDAQELRFVRFNKAGEELLGFAREDLIAKNDYDLFPKEQADFFTKKDREVLESGKVYDIPEEPIDTKAGRRILHTKKIPILDKRGQPAYLLGISEDITDRKKAEEALLKSEERLKAVLENAPIMINGFSPDGELTFWNRELERVAGWTKEEARSQDVLALAYPDSEAFRNIKQVIAQADGVFREYHPSAKDGRRMTHLWADFSLSDGSVMSFGIDITERKKAEEALSQSEELLRTTFENASIGVCLVGMDGRFLRVNQTLCQLLGYSEKELVQMRFNDVTHVDDRDIGATFVNRAVSGEVDAASFEKRYVHKSGEFVWAQVSSTLLRRPTGEPRYFITHIQDITERRRAEERLHLLDFALNHVHEAAFLIDRHSRLRFVNEESCRRLGYTRSELLGLRVSDVDPDFPIDRWPSHWDDLKAQGSLVFEGRHKAKDGGILPVEISANYFEYGGEGYNLALVRDISERKQAELERLSNLQFFESMDRVNRAIQGSPDLEQMMSDVLDTVLSIFDCDRAWLVYPCDPEAASWRAPMERTRSGYPGVLDLGVDIPMAKDVARTFRTVLSSDGPVQFGPQSEYPLPEHVSERFGFQSFIGMALYPKVGKAWEFGLHQCSHPRVWTPEEERLFQEIGRRLTDGLSTLLAHRDLQESECRYREIFENTSDAIFLLDVTSDGRFMLGGASPVGEKMIGLLNQEVMGKLVEDAISEKMFPQLIANCHRCVESGVFVDYEEEVDLPSGSRWVHTTLIPVVDVADRVYRIVAVSRDISAIRLAELELQKTNNLLRTIIEAAPTAIIGLDLDGNVQHVWNPAAEEMLGWSAHEAMGRPLPSVSTEKQEEFRQFRERIRSGKTIDGVEVSRLRRDGKPIDYSIHASPLHDPEGRITGNIAVLVDITQRKKSERISKARLALSDYAYDHTLDELLQKTLDVAESLTESQIGFFHFLESDQETLSLQMWSTNTLEKMCTAEGKGSHYPVKQAGVWVDCIRQRGPVIHNDYEALPHRKGMPAGHAKVTRELVVPVFQGDAIVAIMGVGNKPSEYVEADVEVMSKVAEMAWDIVVRKKAEDALLQRDEILTSIMEALTHPFYIVNVDDYTIQMSNRAALASSVSEGVTCYAAIHGQTVPCKGAHHPCPMEILKSTGKPTMVEHVHYDAEGRRRNVEVYAYPIADEEGKVKQIIEYCLDVTDRTEAQKSLLDSERNLKTILSLSPSGIAYFRDGKITWVNRAMLELFGYREDEQDDMFAMSPRRFYESEEEYARVRGMLVPNLNEGRPAEVEARFRRKNGSVFVGSMAVSPPISDHIGTGTTVVISDITERKAAEEERARLVTVIEQSAESIVVTDRKGTIQYVNPAFEKLTGYSAGEAEGKNPRILKSGAHGPEYYRKMWDTLTSGESWRGHLVNKKKDGSLFEEEATISPVKDKTGDIVNYVAVKRDVTDRVLLEKQLQQAQKMESIGTLAAGIAHDFNNLLFVITGNAELALDQEPPGSELREYIEEALKAARRATDLVRQILAFSRQRTEERAPISIVPVLKEVVKFLRASIPTTIEIALHVDENPGLIAADPTEIHQILMNLCTNAAHSMRTQGGLLEVRLSRVEVNHEFAALHDDIAPGWYAKLTVKDTGHGVSAEDLERIFDPYFTTKQRGEGTGLGLAVVHGIVRSYGGTVSVSSEPGKGSTFHVYFPVHEERAARRADMPSQALPTGRETILVVDDERQVTRIVHGILKSLGYHVVPVNDSLEALDLFKARPDEFDLVITDMTMPKMTGIDLAKELMSLKPDTPIVLCTGFSELVNQEYAEKLGFRSFLVKPIRKAELAQTVDSLLHAGRTPQKEDERTVRE